MTGEVQVRPPSDRVLAAALDAADVLIVVLDRHGAATYVNSAVLAGTGYTREELAAMSVADRIAPEDRDAAREITELLWRGEQPGPRTLDWLAKDGRRLRVRWRWSLLHDGTGRTSHVVAVGIDVTEQHAAERARRAAEERFQLSFDRAPVGMVVSLAADGGDDRVVLSVNRELCRMLGYGESELVGRSIATFTHPDDVAPERRWRRAWLAAGGDDVFQYEKRYVTASGEPKWAALHVSLIEGEDGRRYFLSHVVDIDERRRAERARVAGTVDPLTGLLTEPAFLRDLSVRLAEDLPLSVLRWQLLPAADVRSAHGPAAADRLVEDAANRLAATLPADACLARTATDEFAAFFKGTGRESLRIARDAAARIAGDPPTWPAESTPLAFAAGVAACDPGQQERAEALYAYAGVALEDAVRGGRGAALSGRAERERAGKRVAWQRRLRHALADESAFLVHGQPVCDLATGDVVFTELSLRMRDDEGKLVYPAVFLPVAESTGLMLDIDRWLLRRAIALIQGRPGERFAVRLSAATLTDRRASERAADLIAAAGEARQRLVVEIVGAEAPVQLRSAAIRLRACGCDLVLLNFGMALGSLHHAKTLPVSAIKIHGTFVRDLESSEPDRVVMRAIAEAAHAYGRVLIAEFVESAALAGLLRELGVDQGQGFHFGRPGPVA